jgi:hypothetical protein
MRTRPLVAAVSALTAALLATPAFGQVGAVPAASSRPIGEDYHVEISGGFWGPSPGIIVSSEQLGIPGTEIDFEEDLGISKKQVGQLDVVLRPARRHKFRFGLTRMTYAGDAILARDLVFNAIRYRVALPVTSELAWKQYRFGYEWDFISNDRGFAGLLLDVKYTDVNITLSNPTVGTEFAHARAPVPSIGGIGRVYAMPNLAVTFELSALKVPKIEDEYEVTWIDWNLYGTYDVTKNFGARFGYKVMNINYLFDQDTGDMDLKGLYFGGVLRF